MNTLQIAEQDAVAALVERGRPGSPLARYIKAAMHHESYEQSAVDQSWQGGLAELPALHAEGTTRVACRAELHDELESWLLAQIAQGLPVPAINRIPLPEWIALKRGS
jgi:predicted RNase H-like HicB family nuclease